MFQITITVDFDTSSQSYAEDVCYSLTEIVESTVGLLFDNTVVTSKIEESEA